MAVLPNSDGCLTGVGSLPHDSDHLALALIERYCPEVPFLPQFPRRGRFEQMILEPFRGLEDFISESGKITVGKGRLEALRHAARTRELSPLSSAQWGSHLGKFHSSARAVKAQIVGPLTLLTQIEHTGGSLASTEEGPPLAFDLLLRRARELIDAMSVVDFPKILVFDEPVLPYLKKKDLLERSPILQTFVRLARALRDDVTVGLHCCGALEGEFFGVLWDRLEIELLSVPIEYSKRTVAKLPATWLPGFLERGGSLMLGLVPTVRRGETATVDRFVEKLQNEEQDLGVPLGKLLSRSMLTAHCGLAFLSDADAEENFARLEALQGILRESV